MSLECVKSYLSLSISFFNICASFKGFLGRRPDNIWKWQVNGSTSFRTSFFVLYRLPIKRGSFFIVFPRDEMMLLLCLQPNVMVNVETVVLKEEKSTQKLTGLSLSSCLYKTHVNSLRWVHGCNFTVENPRDMFWTTYYCEYLYSSLLFFYFILYFIIFFVFYNLIP